MATITRENLAPLNDKLVVTILKDDYLPTFEKSLKGYAKNANIPGFRKGMVPAGLVKKMYGQGILSEEVIKAVDAEINKYIQENKLQILAQPIPLEEQPVNFDVNNPTDYSFEFEIGIQPEANIDVKGIKVKRYQVEVTDKMIDEEIERLIARFGKYNTPETVEAEDTIISADIQVTEGENKGDTAVNLKDIAKTQQKEFKGKKVGDTITVQLDKAFKGDILNRVLSDLKLDKENKEDAKKEATLTITKIGLLEKAALDEELFKQVYQTKEIKTEEAFRAALKEDLANYFAQQASGQIHDQIYHHLTDHISIELPEPFLKRWIVVSSEGKKTQVEADEEYPAFAKQLQWAIISSKLSEDNEVKVEQQELKDFARHQLMSYLGGQMGLNGDESWMDEYVNKMMGDRKFIDDAYGQIRIGKLFGELEKQVTAKDETITEEKFAELLKEHQHAH
ncbi:MAG TPA: trigger factor [Arachidicoccus soli]|nr:trigger factor [Arachidicoccus soli]